MKKIRVERIHQTKGSAAATMSAPAFMRGDHIDLWNKGKTKTYSDPANKSAQLWFWEL
jgi:hypothetical protein